jgi:hypothetical protein
MKVKPAPFTGPNIKQYILNTYKVLPSVHCSLYAVMVGECEGRWTRDRKGVIYMPRATFPLPATINHCGATVGASREGTKHPTYASAIPSR